MSVTLHTSKGDLKIELECEKTPKAAENFLALCASEYYNNSPIHRHIPGFLFQTGRPAHPPDADHPKAGQSIWRAPFANEIHPQLKHDRRGVVAMANRGPDTNGSQFFVMFDKAPQLDGAYTVFGRVCLDDNYPGSAVSEKTLAKIESVERGRKDRPVEPMCVESVTIHANPLAE